MTAFLQTLEHLDYINLTIRNSVISVTYQFYLKVKYVE